MKIGIDARAARWYRGTGIGTYTYQLIHSIKNIKENNIYYIHCPKNINLSSSKNMKIISTKEHNYKNFWDEIQNPNNIETLNLDLYHIPQNGIGMPSYNNCPYVITLHDIIPYRLPETVSEKFLSIFNNSMQNIVENCSGIITVSNFSKQDIIKAFNFPEEKIFVTPLASEKFYKPTDKSLSKNIIKKHYGIEDNFILYVGGFSPRKNIIRIIQSFHLLLQHYNKNLKLVIAGKKGISYELYKKEVMKYSLEDKVLFPGFIKIEHMTYLYNACELFVYPSLYEGFGLPPIEAMACGIPVITSNITSIPEVVENGAILVNPYDPYAISKKMYEVLNNKELAKNLKYLGIKRANKLSWEKTTLKTIEAYKNIINS